LLGQWAGVSERVIFCLNAETELIVLQTITVEGGYPVTRIMQHRERSIGGEKLHGNFPGRLLGDEIAHKAAESIVPLLC
jgi:hypothetical protein